MKRQKNIMEKEEIVRQKRAQIKEQKRKTTKKKIWRERKNKII